MITNALQDQSVNYSRVHVYFGIIVMLTPCCNTFNVALNLDDCIVLSWH